MLKHHHRLGLEKQARTIRRQRMDRLRGELVVVLAEYCSSYCCDNTEEREAIAGCVAAYLMGKGV